MFYTQWSSTEYYESAEGFTNSIFYGPAQTVSALTFSGEDYAQTYRVRLAWPGGTSTALQTATRYTEATQIATERDSDGNITNVDNIIGDDNTTQGAPFGGGATASTSFPVTYRPTETASFALTYATIGSGTATTALTATAAATRENNTATSSSSLSGLTTVSQFAAGVSGLYFSNVKENPEFNGVNRFFSNFGRGAGEDGGVTGRRVAAAFEAGLAAGTHPQSISIATNASRPAFLNYSLSIRSGVNQGAVIGKRKNFFVNATSQSVYLSTGADASFYTDSSVSNTDLTGIPSLLVPVFPRGVALSQGVIISPGVLTPRIFTNAESGFSIGTSSATANWSYQTSSWILYTTLANNSTSTSGSAQISFSGSAQTTTAHANYEVGANLAVVGSNRIPLAGQTHGYLGPAIPITLSGFNEVSVSSIAGNISSSDPFFLRTQVATTGAADASMTSRTGVFASNVSAFAGSCSSVFSFGSATAARQVATYAHTQMIAAIGVPGVIIATRTTAGWSGLPDQGLPHPVSLAPRKADKWHEAGQANFVSVRGLPAARTAFL